MIIILKWKAAKILRIKINPLKEEEEGRKTSCWANQNQIEQEIQKRFPIRVSRNWPKLFAGMLNSRLCDITNLIHFPCFVLFEFLDVISLGHKISKPRSITFQ